MRPLILIIAYDAVKTCWSVRIQGYPEYIVFHFDRIETLAKIMDASPDEGGVRYEFAARTLDPHPEAWLELVHSGLAVQEGMLQ